MADQVIQFVGDVSSVADYETASRHLLPLPGCTVVEMVPIPERSGEVLIANGQGAEWRIQPDVGTVLAAGSGVGLIPGDQVLVDHSHGKRLVNFYAGQYTAKQEVRMYGCACQSGGKAVVVPWFRSILATMEDEKLRASDYNVIIDRGDIVEQTDGGVYLPDNHTFRESKGVVVSAGAGCSPLEPGMTVFYMANLMKPLKGYFGYKDGEKVPKNYGIVPFRGVLCQIIE